MSQHKACIACASSKRKCDRKLPGCTRCLEKGARCTYTQRKKRRIDSTVQPVESIADPTPVQCDLIDAMGDISTIDWNWDATNSFDFVEQFTINDLELATVPSFGSTPISLDSSIGISLEATLKPWFLRLESWKLQHHIKDPDCALEVNYEPYVIEVRSMLRSWSTTGCNTFIHRKLYEKSMPQCIQEAFTMLSAYFHCDSSMKSAVLQIAEDHSHRLAQQSLPEFGDGRRILCHLARVHALFAYVFVRLFDGSIRLRVSAEKQVPLLRSWISEMVDEATQMERIVPKAGKGTIQEGLSNSDAEYQDISEQWETWLVAECVRRTHIIVNTILNVYLCLSVGQAECSGFLMMTARRGLWQAESAIRWSKIVSSESPLLVSIANPGKLISEHSANEFDEVVQLLWKYIVGPDRIQRWVENSKKVAEHSPQETLVV